MILIDGKYWSEEIIFDNKTQPTLIPKPASYLSDRETTVEEPSQNEKSTDESSEGC